MSLNRMRCFLAAAFLAVPALAQQPAQQPAWKPQNLQQPDQTVTYASAADVAALAARAKKERKNDSPLVVGRLLQLAPYAAYLEYREKSKLPSDVGLHPKYAELVYVIRGSGTYVLGGTVSADRMRIDGGDPKKIAKGDFLFIPENTPHWISHVDHTIELVSIHVPRQVPAP